ncbi:hypothetical protein G1C95_2047 [Bifidobacterium sp. DSM 109957]|uniref:Lipoprotein n=2 Tax=Bifidobacterium oedipodis TaxID=2675322 RepID=A0A7Y0ER08_9BIFI|nr:hypothetical protein [Bifidobacterium sp. DSM 109957]
MVSKARMVLPVLCLVMGLTLTGCSNGGGEGQKSANPWSAEIQRIESRTDNDMVRAILKDGSITDAEFEEFMESYNQCLAQYDLTSSYSRDDGSESVADQFSQYEPDQLSEKIEQCRNQTGYFDLVPLDQQMHANPDNVSDDELQQKVFECRKRHGLIDSGMSIEEYKDIMGATSDSTDSDPLANSPFADYYQDTDSADTQQWFSCETDPSA